MNPYYQNQQFGFPNQGAYYGYNQNAYQNYAYTNPTQTIQAMYTTVHPYNNKQFLLNTFGNKLQYISIFLTLSHQDKLKMYMLMQQKKLYGEMSDKEAYQKILKQIAQKIQNFNLFHQSDSNKKASQTKSKELQSKIDLIVQQTFEKLNLVQNQPKSNQFQQKRQEADDQEQWIQSTETIELQKQNNKDLAKPTTQSKSKQIQVSNPIFNMFTFDNTMQEAMTHQIGLKTVHQLQKKSIWQLQVDQTEFKPNFKQIFKVKTFSQLNPQQKLSQNEISEYNVKSQSLITSIQNKHQATIFPINADSIYDLYKINYAALQITTNKRKQQKQNQQQKQFKDYMITTHHQPNPVQNTIDFDNIIFENTLSLQISQNHVRKVQISNFNQNKTVQTQQIQNQNKVQQEENQEFQFAQQSQQNIQQINSQQNPDILSLQNPQIQVKTLQQANLNTLDYQTMLFDSVEVQAPSVQIEFNFLEVLSSPRDKIQVKYQLPQNSLSNKLQEVEIGQALFQSQLFSQNGMPQPPQITQRVSQKKIQSQPLDLIQSSLVTHNWQHQEMLKKLKIQMNEQDKSTALKGLKNKSFECSLQFYSLIINYLRQISLQWGPEYRHMTLQYKIVKQLLEQSQRYTSAVDQDQQQKVGLSIRKTKELLSTIYQNSSKTQKYVVSLLDDKCRQKGLLYKFGRNLLSSSLSTEIFQKVINQDKKQILKSFTVLYIIQKLSSIRKLKFFSQKLMIYLGIQYQKYKNLQEQNLRQVQNQEQSYPKFILFVKGVVKICNMCQRMIALLKLCCVKTNSNTVKLLKICKDIKVKYSQYDNSKNSDDLMDFQEVIKTNIQRNKSVYDLHNDFFKNYKEKPLCGICLKQTQNDGDIKQEIYYHYSCFNLSLRLQKQIQYFTQ